MANPFILTAALPSSIQSWADGLRRAHYPPERNYLHAHVTLFHSFAPSLLDELKTLLPRLASEYAAPSGRVTGLMDMGTGTAIALESEELLNLRAIIADHFHGSLTEQDLHEPRLHITVQNKVTKREARELQASLSDEITLRSQAGPFVFPALELHRYLGGPWDAVKRCAFRGKAQA